VHDEAPVEMRAVGAQAVLARRSDLRPHRRGFRNVHAFGAIAGRAHARETLDFAEIAHVLPACESAIRQRALEMMVADVVRAPFEDRHGHRELQRLAYRGNVPVEKLVLKRLGAGGNDHLAAGAQRGREVRESLPRAGAGFCHQHGVVLDRRGHCARHVELKRPRAETRNDAGEGAFCNENRFQIEHAPSYRFSYIIRDFRALYQSAYRS
jgi:hypothetical protein